MKNVQKENRFVFSEKSKLRNSKYLLYTKLKKKKEVDYFKGKGVRLIYTQLYSKFFWPLV